MYSLLFEFRFVAKLNEIFKFVVMGYILWSVLTMCAMLVFFLNQIVEYSEAGICLCTIQIKRSSISSFFCIFLCIKHTIKGEWSLDALSASLLVLSSYTFLFVFCNFGQNLTDQFQLFEAEMYKFKWYLFPIGMQQTFACVMINVQQLAMVKGFGNIELSRETAKKVNKSDK